MSYGLLGLVHITTDTSSAQGLWRHSTGPFDTRAQGHYGAALENMISSQRPKPQRASHNQSN